MAVLQLKDEPKCKLCKHAKRSDIDALLEKRSRRGKIGGKAVTLEFVLGRLAEYGVENPTRENVTVHWKKHCEVVDEKVQAAVEAAAADDIEAELDLIFGPSWREAGPLGADALLEWARTRVGRQAIEKVRAGGSLTGTEVEQLTKLADAAHKRRQGEAVRELMGTMGEALGHALGAAPPRPALPPGEVVDGEAEEIEEAEVG